MVQYTLAELKKKQITTLKRIAKDEFGIKGTQKCHVPDVEELAKAIIKVQSASNRVQKAKEVSKTICKGTYVASPVGSPRASPGRRVSPRRASPGRRVSPLRVSPGRARAAPKRRPKRRAEGLPPPPDRPAPPPPQRMPAVAPRARREVAIEEEIQKTADKLRELLKKQGITEGLSTRGMTRGRLETWVDAPKCEPDSPCADDFSCYIRSKKGVVPPKGVCIPTGDVEDRLFRYVRNGREFVGTRVAINALKRNYPEEVAAAVDIAEEGDIVDIAEEGDMVDISQPPRRPPPLRPTSVLPRTRRDIPPPARPPPRAPIPILKPLPPTPAPMRRREISPVLEEEPLAVREPRYIPPPSLRAQPRISSRRRRVEEPLRLRPIPEMGGMVEELVRPAQPLVSPEAVRWARGRIFPGEPGYIPRRLGPLMRPEDVVIEEEEPAPEDIADVLQEIREPAQIVVDELSEVQRLALQCLGVAV